MMDRRERRRNLVRLVLTGRAEAAGGMLSRERAGEAEQSGKDIQGDSGGRLTREVSHCAIGWQE